MKKSLLTAGTAVVLLLASQGVSPATPVPAGKAMSSPADDAQARGPGYESIELPHQISWDDAATMSSAETVVGFRYAGPGVYGEAFGGLNELELVASSLSTDLGYLPAITHILVRDDGPRAKRAATEADLTMEAAAFESYEPVADLSRGYLWERTREIVSREEALESQPGRVHRLAADDDQAWAPPNSEVIARDGDVDSNGDPSSAHSVAMWMQWSSSSERRPEDFPQDWVLEAELNTYSNNDPDLNPGGIWKRPLCFLDSNESYFWSGSNPNHSIDAAGNFLGWSIATLDQSLVPEEYGAYLDHLLASDDCDRKSIGVGIGYPQDAPLLLPGVSGSRGFITTVYMPQGWQDSNKVASGYQLVSNDCPGAPNTNCTDLNLLRPAPNGWVKGSLIANRSREFTAPGCHYYNYYSGNDPVEYDC